MSIATVDDTHVLMNVVNIADVVDDGTVDDADG